MMLDRRPRTHSLLILLVALLLSGCKVELYSELSERQGNEILALLLSHGIAADKIQGKGAQVAIRVNEADVALAVDLLDRRGLPREDFVTLGEVFEKK